MNDITFSQGAIDLISMFEGFVPHPYPDPATHAAPYTIGFGSTFYSRYQDVYPLHSGYKIRKKLYNLYHILNHLNLFGSGYLSQANTMIASLLAEIR